jgi:glycosyltransferase involved in cell wall biosynthesis
MKKIKIKQSIAKDRRLKLFFNSNAPWANSGYGVEMRDLLSRLLKDGWQTAQSCFHGLDVAEPIHYSDPPFNEAPLLCYPKMMDTWGSDALFYHARHYGANVAFTMQDVQVLNPQFLQQLQQAGIPWIPWVPIDKEPVPQNVLQTLQYAHKIVTFSHFGQRALEKKGFTSTLLLEGTDTNVFKPGDKAAARAKFGLPQDKFIVGMVGANKPDGIPRKGWEQALDAMKMFKDVHPEAIFFYQTNQPGGFPILDYAYYIGLKDSVFFLDEYLAVFHSGSQVMNDLYNAFDMLIHPSTTEGFGLCVIEALSAGCPVIVNNCTSMPELVLPGETGEICEVKMRMWTPGQGYIYFADPESLYEKMEKIFKADRQVMAAKARQFVLDNYDIDKLVEKNWIPFLEELQEELLGKPNANPTLQLPGKGLELSQLNNSPVR